MADGMESSLDRTTKSNQGTRTGRTLAVVLSLVLPLFIGDAAQASQYQALESIGNWTLYRNNNARIFRNYAPPLAIGLESEDGQAAIVIDCRPELHVLRPKDYGIRTAQFYLNFVPSMRGLVSSPWQTPVAFWSQGSGPPGFTTLMPFVTGITLERLSFNVDSLYDEAQTVINLPIWVVRELNNQLEGGSTVVARFYNFNDQRVELTFDAEGFNKAYHTLLAGCDRINEYAGKFE